MKKQGGKRGKSKQVKKQGGKSKLERYIDAYHKLVAKNLLSPEEPHAQRDVDWMKSKISELTERGSRKICVARPTSNGKEHKWGHECVGCDFSLEQIAYEASNERSKQFPPGTEKQNKILRSWRLSGEVATRECTDCGKRAQKHTPAQMKVCCSKTGELLVDKWGCPLLEAEGIRLLEEKQSGRVDSWLEEQEIEDMNNYFHELWAKCAPDAEQPFEQTDFVKYVLLSTGLEAAFGRAVLKSGTSMTNEEQHLLLDIRDYVKKRISGLRKMDKVQRTKTAKWRRKTPEGTAFDQALETVKEFMEIRRNSTSHTDREKYLAGMLKRLFH